MRLALMSIGFGLLAASPMTAQDKAAKPDLKAEHLKKLQGDWHVMKVIKHVNRDKEHEAGGFHYFKIKDDTFEEINEGFTIHKGSITLDPTKSPKHIDISIGDGYGIGKTMIGIYEFSKRGPVLNLSGLSGEKRPEKFEPYTGQNDFFRGKMILVSDDWKAEWADKPAVAIEFRWAEDKAIAGVTQKSAVELSCSKEKQYLHEKAILANADIAKVDVLPMPNTNGEKVYIEVRLTKEAEKVMMASSEANQNKPLVVLVDGKIVAAIVVMTKLTNVIPVVSPLSKAEAERIAKGIAGLKL